MGFPSSNGEGIDIASRGFGGKFSLPTGFVHSSKSLVIQPSLFSQHIPVGIHVSLDVVLQPEFASDLIGNTLEKHFKKHIVCNPSAMLLTFIAPRIDMLCQVS